MPDPLSIKSLMATPAARAAFLTAVVSGTFCVLLALVMFIAHVRSKMDDPLKAPHMAALKEQLAASPKNEELKEQIRTLDLELRHSYFRDVARNASGGWMLLVGVSIFLLAAKKLHTLRQSPPMPRLRPDAAEQAARGAMLARRWVAGVAAGLALTFVALGVTRRPSSPANATQLAAFLAEATGPTTAPAPGPSPAEYRQNWPEFRGPGGSGVSVHTNVPLQWDMEAGTGLIWKTSVPAGGFNSPVVWGNHIFLSGGGKEKREVMCFDLATGALQWQRAVENVPGSTGELPDIPEQTGFAAPTMATDGERAYVIFASGDVAAFTFDGNLAWAKHLGVPHNPHGHASSLTTWQDRLLVQLDQGTAEERLSKLYAFDGATGEILWQRQRPVGESWASPIVIEAAGRPQVITLGLPWLMAHDARDGTELWRADCLEGEVTPSPVFAANQLFVVNPNTYLLAIRPDGQGDVTETHISWKAEDGIPDITSPVTDGELIFLASTFGMVTAYDAKDGTKLWEQDFETDINASPILVGNRLLIVTVEGTGIVLEAGRTFKELSRSELGEKVYATPAFVENRMILRGAEHLYCFGTKDEAVAGR